MKLTKYLIPILIAVLAVGGAAWVAGQPSAPGEDLPPVVEPESPGDVPETPETPDPSEPSTPETPDEPVTPAPDPEAIAFFDCGMLDLKNGGEVTGRENFAEFLNVTGVGKSARIQITQYTVEGDPIVQTLTFDNGSYALTTDNSADAFAADPGVTTATYAQLLTLEKTQDGALYQYFVLSPTVYDDLDSAQADEAAVILFSEPLEDR